MCMSINEKDERKGSNDIAGLFGCISCIKKEPNMHAIYDGRYSAQEHHNWHAVHQGIVSCHTNVVVMLAWWLDACSGNHATTILWWIDNILRFWRLEFGALQPSTELGTSNSWQIQYIKHDWYECHESVVILGWCFSRIYKLMCL